MAMQKRFFSAVFLTFLLWLFQMGVVPSAQAVGSPAREALLKFSKRLSPAEIQKIFETEDAELLQYFPRTRIYHVAFPSSEALSKHLESLRSRKGVLVAVPDRIVEAQALPDDPDFDLQWALKNVGQDGGAAGNDIGIESVWDEFQDTGEIVVAVIDSGVDYLHPDLADNIWTNLGEIPDNGIDDDGNGYIDDVHGFDFFNGDSDPMDDFRHGTHVAGIVGAAGNNGIGVSGVAWHAKIMPLKFLDDSGFGTASGAIPAIEYALANGAKILVNSWGDRNFDAALFNAVLAADDEGVLFFAAAGNQASDNDEDAFYPAGYDSPNVVSVASIDAEDRLSSFSNYGHLSVDIAAPGRNIYSTKPQGTYGYISGTSMATPYAAGAAAVLWSQFPGLSHRQVRNLLLQGGSPRSYLQARTLTGSTLDVSGALAVARDTENQAPIVNAGPDVELPLGSKIQTQASVTDPDGDSPLIYEWEFMAPPGSLSRLDSPFVLNPSFVPDREGVYVATLRVADSLSEGVPDSVTYTIQGGSLPPPVPVFKVRVRFQGRRDPLNAEATVPRGATVEVDAGGSQSLFPQNLLYEWSLIEKPEGSLAQLSSFDAAAVDILADQPGVYTLRLRLEDGYHENIGELSFSALGDAVPPSMEIPNSAEAPSSSQNSAGGCSLRPVNL